MCFNRPDAGRDGDSGDRVAASPRGPNNPGKLNLAILSVSCNRQSRPTCRSPSIIGPTQHHDTNGVPTCRKYRRVAVNILAALQILGVQVDFAARAAPASSPECVVIVNQSYRVSADSASSAKRRKFRTPSELFSLLGANVRQNGVHHREDELRGADVGRVVPEDFRLAGRPPQLPHRPRRHDVVAARRDQ